MNVTNKTIKSTIFNQFKINFLINDCQDLQNIIFIDFAQNIYFSKEAVHRGAGNYTMVPIINQSMGCQNSHEASNPLPPLSTPSNVVAVAPNPEPASQPEPHLEKNVLITFQDRSVTPPTPTRSTKKELSQREKNYIYESRRKLSIEEVSVEKQAENEPETVIINVEQLKAAMMKEMRMKDIYSGIIEADYMCKILQEISCCYVSKDKTEEILLIMMSYMREAHRSSSSQDELQTYTHRLGQQLLQVKQETSLSNANSLKIMQYLRNDNSQASSSFLNFKFDLSVEELEKVIISVKGMLKYSEKSVYFILIYLEISINRLLKSLVSILQVEEKILSCITLITNSLIDISPSPLLSLPSFPKQAYAKKIIDFKNVAKDSRVEFTESFIGACAIESQKEYLSFRQLLWRSGSRWGKSVEILLFNKSDWAMLEAKRSIADVQMEKVNLEETSKEIDELTMDDLFFLEQLTYKEQLKEILAFIDAPIELKTRTLMQAHLFFQHTNHIRDYLDALRQQISLKSFILVKVTNHLAKGSGISEVVMQISLNGVSAEVHLILSVNYSSQFYNKFLKLLINNRNFTYCSHLKMIAQSFLPLYLSEMKEIISINSHQKGKDKNLQHLSQCYFELESLLHFSIPDKSMLQINPLLLNEGISLYKSMKDASENENGRGVRSLSRLTRMMDFKRIMKDPSADLLLNEFYHSFEQKDLASIEIRLHRKEKIDQYDIDLLKNYADHVKQAGLRLFKKDLIEKAQAKFQTYICVTNLMEDEVMKAQGRLCLALLEHKKGNFNRTLQILEKCLEVVDKHDNSKIQLPFLQLMAKVYTDQEKFEPALKILEKYLDILKDSDGDHVRSLEIAAQLHYKMGEWEKSAQNYKVCLQSQETKTGFDSYQCAEYLIRLSETQNKQGNKEGSLVTADRCLKVIQNFHEEEGAIEREINVRRHIASLLIDRGDYESAVSSLQANLQLIQQRSGKFNFQFGDILQEIGQIYELSQNYQQSLINYQHSLMIKERIDRKSQAKHLDLIARIARVHQRLNNPAKCMKYQTKIGQIQSREREDHSKDHVNTFISIAKKSLEKGNYPLSLKYFQKSLLILEEQKGKESAECIPLLRSMGLAYKLQGHLQESIQLFSDSLTLLERHKGKNNIEAAESYYEIGSIYDSNNSYELAQTYYLAALQLCEKFNVKYTVFANSNFGLANLYFRQQMYSKAFECYERSLPLLEKLYPKLYSQAVQNMEVCDREIEQQFPHTADQEAEFR